jgi:hypothetical protein
MDEGKGASGMQEKSSSVAGLKNGVESKLPVHPQSAISNRFKSIHRPCLTPAPGHYNPKYQSIYAVNNQRVMTS